VAVDLASGRTARAEIRLAERATTLAATVIKGRRSTASRDLENFMERKRRSAAGRFLTREDLDRLNPFSVSEALRTTPGVRVVPTSSFGSAILGRGGCLPAVFLDGMALQDGAVELDRVVRPQEVAAVEIYMGVGTAPMQYRSSDDGCGSVVVWTRR
jgi:hypothetical protein